jgi:trimethylamine:corrinoid methyltransferase-like protein
MSAEMVVIHSDLLRLIERIRLGVEVSDKMLAADSIIQAGPGGHFLEDPLTLEMLRSGEFFTAGCFDRTGERSPNRFEDSLLARAHRRVEELLAAHTPAVPENVAEEVHRWATNKCAALP